MKYIDADLLRKEIKRLEKAAHKSALGCEDSETRKFHEGKDFAYQHVGVLIGSLQQEQQEVDLEKEISTWIPAHISGGDNEVWRDTKNVIIEWAGIVARHFYELGLKARREEK